MAKTSESQNLKIPIKMLYCFVGLVFTGVITWAGHSILTNTAAIGELRTIKVILEQNKEENRAQWKKMSRLETRINTLHAGR